MAKKAKKVLSFQDIQIEYTKACSEIGDKVYRVGLLQKEIDVLKVKAREWNEKGLALAKTLSPQGQKS